MGWVCGSIVNTWIVVKWRVCSRRAFAPEEVPGAWQRRCGRGSSVGALVPGAGPEEVVAERGAIEAASKFPGVPRVPYRRYSAAGADCCFSIDCSRALCSLGHVEPLKGGS